LRTGTIRFDWANTSIIAGQDTLFIAPLVRLLSQQLHILRSLTPEIFGVGRRKFASSTDSISPTAPESRCRREFSISFWRRALRGIRSRPNLRRTIRLPALAARVSWSHPVQDRSLTLGVSGYYSRQAWGDAATWTPGPPSWISRCPGAKTRVDDAALSRPGRRRARRRNRPKRFVEWLAGHSIDAVVGLDSVGVGRN